ncbi:MAG: chitobiase/beta-hexosaminidase C-terminal domain-containing protein [Eubacterium sp.]|nr:chitobiase/beta-hexosaminidase C-terminal domain-containing protein [Eubacterium sp.]
MIKMSAFGSLILIFAIIATFIIPSSGPLSGASIGVLEMSQREKADYVNIRQNVDIPAELPYLAQFSEDDMSGDFVCDVTSSVSSGYYSKPQTVMLESKYDLYYTTDGTIPDINSTKYDPATGIYIDENTFLTVRAFNNGKVSTVLMGSYVIFKDTTSYKYAYGYNSLNETDQYIYEKMYDAISNFETEFDVGNYGISFSRLNKIMFILNYDNPMLFQAPNYLNIKKGTQDDVRQVNIYYAYNEAECELRKRLCEQRVDEIFSEADGSKSLMDYLVLIHRSILSKTVYYDDTDEMDIYEAYGVLVNGQGVCESYSRAFEYVCQRMGLDNLLIVGDSEGVSHMWNMIKMDNEWYHIDLTWDDGDNDEIYCDFFNVDDKTITTYGYREISPIAREGDVENGKEIYNYYEIPEAYSMYYNYSYYYFGEVYDELYY